MSSEVVPYHIPAASVGERAWGVFGSSLTGSVIGVTSGGIFIRAGSDQIVFVSRLQYRSPLTITLGSERSALQLLEVGMTAEFSPDWLLFPKPGLLITADLAERWTAPPPAANTPCDPDGFSRRLRDLGARALEKKGNVGLSILLPVLLQLPGPENELDPAAERVLAVCTALQECRFSSPEKILKSILGLGRGLTPSGDDLLVGFLLALNRWREVLQPPFDVDHLNVMIVNEAHTETTCLSANLIACAAAGAADERLIDGVDYAVAGQGDLGIIADRLDDMGSSSGVDSLVGIVLAFTGCGMLLSDQA